MATLRNLASKREHPLSPRYLIGRAPACQLRLDDPGVSGHHAELVWDGERWKVQDLGSRNGTTLGERALARGERVPLPCNVDLVLAGVVRLRLVDDSPPCLFAEAGDGELRRASDELLSLPSDEQPELTIFRELDGRWWVELATETRELGELDTVIAGGRSWRVFSPSSLPLTREIAGSSLLAEQELRFRVSRDGEHVELDLVNAAGVINIEPRVHLGLLLTLARARIADARNPTLPETEHGWVYREELPRMLGIEPELINLWSHRARRQLAQAKIRDAAAVIERRTDTAQLRIGVSRLRVDEAC